MSIRAYKVTKLEHRDSPTLRLSELPEGLLNRMVEFRGPDLESNGGIMEVDREWIEALRGTTDDAEEREILEDVLEDFEDGDEFVMYYCF